VKASERALKEAEEIAQAERAKIASAKASLEKDLASQEAGRARIVAEVPEDLLVHYDRIAKKHRGVALAEVREERCGACGMIVRPHVIQEMRRAGSDEMFHCETCTRILYYVEPAESATPAAPSGVAVSGASTAGSSPES
jgi:predicted  nucleic acid-binding Zn-ribbon protein